MGSSNMGAAAGGHPCLVGLMGEDSTESYDHRGPSWGQADQEVGPPRSPATVGHGPAFAGIYLMLVQHCMQERVAFQLEHLFSARRVRVQPYEGPRHHYFVLRRRGVARQDRAARVHSATSTKLP